MALVINRLEREDVVAFSDRLGVNLEVHERMTEMTQMRWYAVLRNVEIQEGAFLMHAHGEGEAPYKAVVDLCRSLSGRMLHVGNGRKGEDLVRAPILTCEDFHGRMEHHG